MKWIDRAWTWFASFFEKAFVSRVKRRIPIRIERFWRSTYEVEICAGSGFPLILWRSAPRHTPGL
jgi:hypothetical protein